MHPEADEWVSRYGTTDAVSVLDIGGRDINGNCRRWFPNADYTVLDIAPGPNVDIVADAATWTPDRDYDVVVCTEVFEHTPVWPDICGTAYAALKPGGQAVLTMAGPGRLPHSAEDGGRVRPSEYYGNVDPDDLRTVLTRLGFEAVVDVQHLSHDVRAWAVRP